MNEELGIGDFSRATGITVKALRHYHEVGLMQPARVDVGSGYRYYCPTQVERGVAIAKLRQLEFSIDEIKSLLGDVPDDRILQVLQERRQSLVDRIRAQKTILRQLDELIAFERHANARQGIQDDGVTLKEIESCWVAGIRMQGQYSDVGQGFRELGRKVGRYICGPAMCLFYDQEYCELDANFEPCFPIKKPLDSRGRLVVQRLEAVRAVSRVHVGPYSTLGATYSQIFQFMNRQGLRPAIPSRELYLKGPGMIFAGNPQSYRTEVQIVVHG